TPTPRAADLRGPDVGLVDEPEGQEPLVPERAQLLCGAAALLVADVDGGRRPLTLDEEPAVRGEVALAGPVEIEVVLAEVGERERGEADTVEPPKLGAVRGRLQRAAAIVGVQHLVEGALEIDRLGCRANRRPALASDAALDRAEQAWLASGRGENRMEEERGRRLAVCAGHAGDLEATGRLPCVAGCGPSRP